MTMRAGWTFDRGIIPADGGEVPIRCRFEIQDGDGAGRSAIEMTIPESAAAEMLNDLRTVVSPLTVAGNGSSP